MTFGAPARLALGVFASIAVARADTRTYLRDYGPAAGSDEAAFGSSIVSLPGDVIVVGAPGEEGAGVVHVVDGVTGAEHARLVGSQGSRLGSAIAAIGDVLVAGAPGDGGGAGSIVVVDPVGGTAGPPIVNPTPAVPGFGTSLAASGSLALVGTPGDVFGPASGLVHAIDPVDGHAVTSLASPAPQPGDGFGRALAASSERIVVGAPTFDATVLQAGIVFVYDAQVSDGTPPALSFWLQSPSVTHGGVFGSSVATAGSDIVVGAPGEGAGTVYVFDAVTHYVRLTLRPPGGVLPTSVFGTSVVVTDSEIVVGAPGFSFFDHYGGENGAVYVFDRMTGTLEQTILNPLPIGGGGFGRALGAAGADVLVGIPFDDAAGLDAGRVRRFSERCGSCPSCQACGADGMCAPIDGCQATIWCVGDSITEIYAPALAALEPGWLVVNHGKAGETSAYGLRRLDALLKEADTLPDAAIVLYGTNDIQLVVMLGGTPEQGATLAANYIGQIVERLRSDGVLPLVGLPIEVPRGFQGTPDQERYASTEREGFHALRRLLIRMRPTVNFRLRRLQWYADVAHPNAEGAGVMAHRAWVAVRRALR